MMSIKIVNVCNETLIAGGGFLVKETNFLVKFDRIQLGRANEIYVWIWKTFEFKCHILRCEPTLQRIISYALRGFYVKGESGDAHEMSVIYLVQSYCAFRFAEIYFCGEFEKTRIFKCFF